MCGVLFGEPRKALYRKGAESICARQGGVFDYQMCMDESEDTIIFIAGTHDTPSEERLCNRELEDFYVVAIEPVPAVQRSEFTALMDKLGYKTRTALSAEVQRKRAADAEEQVRHNAAAIAAQNRHNAAAAEARNRLLVGGVEFRRSIKIGDKSNCGPVIEIRQKLAKVYRPVENYGSEHWLEIDTLFPEGSTCSFFNGRYQPPR